MSEVPKYVPLNELDGVDPAPGVEFNGVIPENYVDASQIVIKLRGVHKRMRTGGIRSLRVVGVSGDVSRFVPHIVGMDGKGGALAGLTRVATKVPSSTAESFFGAGGASRNARWIDATVKVNMDEASERVLSQKKPGGIRSAEAWAIELDKAVRSGIREAGTAHLIFDTPRLERKDIAREVLLPFAGIGILSLVGGTVPDLERLPVLYEFFNAGFNIGQFRRDSERGVKHEDGFHFSLFFGPQIDRAAWLTLRTRTGQLIKALQKKE
jgi:hypothetical protein